MKFFASATTLILAAACVAALAQTPPPAGGRGRGAGRGAGPGRGAGGGVSLPAQMLAQGDRDADQSLSADEFSALALRWFDAVDPDQVGRIRQDEFLQRFDAVLSPPAAAGGRGGRGGRGGGSANALGFFTAANLNRDAQLGRTEIQQAFTAWLTAWDADRNGRLDADEITKGLNAVLPKTNMSGVAGRESMDPIPGLPTPPPSPVLSPAESRATIKLVDGFKIEPAATEPMIEDPVALSFDEDGRAYVVEMRNYQLDIDRTGERDPIGRISRLEDTDGDGRFDRASVFLDGLILPRAVAATAGGVLYVNDYKLHFARDTNGDGKADRIELVDADYGRGNVEHAPNALFRAMDNWIYNGESPWRYRVVNGTLVKQATETRGQWGMTQDNYGRLLYNVNNSQLLGDYTPPNYMGRNPHHPTSAGVNLFVATDQRVFPIRMTTAVNRGYSPEVLNSEGKVFVFASSCSPLVYRGDNFPAEFAGNVFVADPAVNLIKRNLLSDDDLTLTSRFAYDDREFLASTDERFRPVNLYNGPDGTLWVIDLYRGIAQYSQFMTAYLRRDTLSRELEKGIHLGRIYRIVSTAKTPNKAPRLSVETPAHLVGRLSDANGWTRDTAQRLLVERGDRTVAPALAALVTNTRADPLGRIHALWTLEGLFAAVPGQAPTPSAGAARLSLLSADPHFRLEAAQVPAAVLAACRQAIGDANPKIQVAAIRVMEALTAWNPSGQEAFLADLSRIEARAAGETRFQAALSAGNLAKPAALPLLARIATSGAEEHLIREALLSGLQHWELPLLQRLLGDPAWSEQRPGRPALLQSLASAVIKERDPARIDTLLALAADERAGPAWRRRSMLEGIAANLQVRPARLIAFQQAPVALAALAQSADAAVREQGERIQALFAWPGHQYEASMAAAAPARPLSPGETRLFETGQTLFQQLCAGCHGLTGQGVTPMAPPLANSDWVLGSENRLIRVTLHGLAGAVTVNGTSYGPPNILPEMPPLGSLDDGQIAAVLTYVRRAWGHQAEPVLPERVGAVRQETRDRKTAWTEELLAPVK